MATTAEHGRLDQGAYWKKWGPYLSERQWGTVREDYSADGSAWDYFPHDHARSRAYHWGEDGLAGYSDDKQQLCFALALWNGRDSIIKERLFGLTNSEGNHGEDVKEYYYYLDSTPTHSYMKYLYKYPQAPYPYNDILFTNRKRGRAGREYELIDTGVFKDDRYFDVFVEYAKENPEDTFIRISIVNRGPDAAPIHVLPTLWFRNTWTWWPDAAKPSLSAVQGPEVVIEAFHAVLGKLYLYAEGDPQLLFTENHTNTRRLYGTPNATPYVKDAFDNYVVRGQTAAVNPERTGTKSAAYYNTTIGPGQTLVLRLRLSDKDPTHLGKPFGKSFDKLFLTRQTEADEFYRAITPAKADEDSARIIRQAMAGMLWTKQYYFFDADKWLDEHNAGPFDPNAKACRNREWFHMVNDHIISMPDKWEYPWYAAWDLAFHAAALSAVDPEFAKDQLELMLRQVYLHPSGQIPAYEWNFSDVNPPVHAWATLFVYRVEQALRGSGDVQFLRRAFNKLMINFTWWVNRKDRYGRNVFEGGFLGLDNIGVFDRSAPLPSGGYLEQADGTAWMAMYCLNMLDMSVELATADPTYEDLAIKFTEHFFWIVAAMNRVGPDGMWDEVDGFYYDVLRLPDGTAQRLKVRSIVGLLPLCACMTTEKWQRDRLPHAMAAIVERYFRTPELAASVFVPGPGTQSIANRGILAMVDEMRLRRILARMLDEKEFLSPYGLRALSRDHLENPYVFNLNDQAYTVSYMPGESNSGMFGGNSNWRGPIWFPVNAMIIRALLQYFLYFGDSFKVECPTGSGKLMNLYEVASEIAARLEKIFHRDAAGRRAVFGTDATFQNDPNWRDYLLFYEYFHGDTGEGIGASHQTGWTGLVGRLIQIFGALDPKALLAGGREAAFQQMAAVTRKRATTKPAAARGPDWPADVGKTPEPGTRPGKSKQRH